MKIALIDCGTNTFHLLVAEVNDQNDVRFLVREQVPVKLGEGGITRKLISEPAFERGINCLKNFSDIIRKVKPDKVAAYGTAAIRMAENNEHFIKAAQMHAGISIEIIDGNREAELIYEGVKRAVSISSDELIMDIGGGSTELIVADASSIKWMNSYEAGASLILEKFRPSDPLSQADISAIEGWFDRLFDGFISGWKGKLTVLNGSAGSFETFAQLAALKSKSIFSANSAVCYDIGLDAFLPVHRDLIESTRQQRLNWKGIPEFRADMIVMASLLLNFIISRMNIQTLRWSAYSLKEGMLFSMLNPQGNKKAGNTAGFNLI